MKKFFAIVLCIWMAVTLTACGSQQSESGQTAIADANELLTTVWNKHADTEQFPVMGGNGDAMNTEGSGVFSLEDPAALDSTLGFPAASVEKIDNAASLVHMMNANTFTCGAYHVAENTDMDALTTEIKENILTRQWLCGFPEQLVIATVDDYIISVFGTAESTNTFIEHLTEAYSSATVVCEQSIV